MEELAARIHAPECFGSVRAFSKVSSVVVAGLCNHAKTHDSV